MKGRADRRDAAIRDVAEVAESIRRHRPRSALRFVDAVEATIGQLAKAPGLGTLFDSQDPNCDRLRYVPVSRFRRYVVFYRPTADGIEVVRVLHGARDLGPILADELGAGEVGGEMLP